MEELRTQVKFLSGKKRFFTLRDGVISTLTLTVLLIVIFQLEFLLSAGLGFSSVGLMFDEVPAGWMWLPMLASPFLHQGANHLVGNLGVLLVYGSYIEISVDEAEIYRFFIVVGYIAAWLAIPFGFTGALGASGVTYGLIGRTFVLGFDQLVTPDSPLSRRIFHLIPAIIAGKVSYSALVSFPTAFVTGDAGVFTHGIGVVFGVFWGLLAAYFRHVA